MCILDRYILVKTFFCFTSVVSPLCLTSNDCENINYAPTDQNKFT